MKGAQQFTLRVIVTPDGEGGTDLTQNAIRHTLLSELDGTYDADDGGTIDVTVMSIEWNGRA